MDRTQVPRLPLELILHILSCLVPNNPRTLLPASHSTTKTLLATALVCHATYPVASKYIRQHCLYLDSDVRLRDFLVCLPHKPFSGPSALTGDTHAFRNITSLYLAPFRRSLDDLPTATWIRELFCMVCGSLRRLVIDMPLRSLYPADDHLNVRKTLREGFSMLTGLEEFVSVRDELYLRVYEPEWLVEEAEVWTLWPELRRLALYNVDADERFWGRVAGMDKLETVILTRADGIQETCMKSSYFATSQRPVDVLVVNVSTEHPREIPRWTWRDVDPQMKMRVMVYDVPTSFYGDEDSITLCQDWVKAAAIRGILWDWQGYLLQPAPVGSGLINPEPETAGSQFSVI